MPRRVDFSSASPREIENLALNSALKHSLDNIHGTTLGTIKYILKNTKKVNMYRYTTLIETTVEKAVNDGKLIVDEAGWYTWPNHMHHYRLRRERMARQRLMTNRSAAFTTLPTSGSQGNIDTSPNERLARKRKRRSKKTQREISSNAGISSDSVSATVHGYSHATHSNTYNVNGEPNKIKEAGIIVAGSSGLLSNQADVAVPGGSGLMLMSNQADVAFPGSSGLMVMSNQAAVAISGVSSPMLGLNQAMDNKKKKRANKRKSSNSQNKEEAQSGAKKHNDPRLYKGRRFKKQ